MRHAIEDIVASVLGVPVEQICDDSGPRKALGWDSLNHLRIILAVEEAFDIKFSRQDYAKTTSVGGLRELVRATVGVRGKGAGCERHYNATKEDRT